MMVTWRKFCSGFISCNASGRININPMLMVLKMKKANRTYVRIYIVGLSLFDSVYIFGWGRKPIN